MTTTRGTTRALGAAFLAVIATSLAAGMTLTAATGDGDIYGLLASVAAQPGLARLSILIELFNAAAIVALASLLYVTLHEQQRVLALVALGWWLAEAITVGVSKLGSSALVPLSMRFAEAGAPRDALYGELATALFYGLDRVGYTLHMFFYCLGGILWYALMVRSRLVPRAIPLFGVAAATVGLAGIAAELLGATVPIYVYLPIGAFELVIGLWLLVGRVRSDPRPTPTRPSSRGTKRSGRA